MCCQPISLFSRLACVAASVLLTSQLAVAEAWTDLNATRTIEAQMVGLWGESVVLQMQDGRKVTVRLDDLNAESRIKARKLSSAKVANRKTMADELRGQAAESAASAPTPLPTPQPAPAYVPPTPGATCVVQMQWLVDQLQAGHMRAYFDTLPMTYRGDLDKLFKQAVGKMDPVALQSLTGSAYKLGDLIVTRQRWLLSQPRLQALQPSSQDFIKAMLLNTGGALRVGLDPQAIDATKLQSIPLQQLVAERSDAIAPYQYAMSSFPGASIIRPTIEMVSEKDGVTKVKVISGEITTNMDYIEVDGFWVAKSTADAWAASIEEANKTLAEVSDGADAASILSAVIGPRGAVLAMFPILQPQLEPMLAAQNEKDFHASLEPLIALVGPMLSQMPGQMRKQRGGYDDMDMGYEDEEMMDMDMDMDMEMEMDMDMEMDMQ